MGRAVCLAAGFGLAALSSAQNISTARGAPLVDPGRSGPALEIAHLYYDQWPTGIAVSDSNRMFSNYPSGLDSNNTYTGTNSKHAVAELHPNNTETPYPTTEYNHPPGGAINYTTTPPTSKSDPDHLIGVQSVVIDNNNTLWILDTGRAIDPQSNQLTFATNPGGAKLVAVNLDTNTVERTILFPPTVAYPDSYLNDVRFDLRSGLSHANSSGVAYITDSSAEGRNGLIVVDLESGNSWRHLDHDPRAKVEQQFVTFVWGTPVYGYNTVTGGATTLPFGADGIALSPDGETLYWDVLSSRYLRAVPTEVLRRQGGASEIMCQAAVRNLGQKGVSDGFEMDSAGNLYMGNGEQEAVVTFREERGLVETFVRDPRINWVDTMSIAGNSLYFTVNQLQNSPGTYPGTDRRQTPYVLFRAPLPNGAHKIDSLGPGMGNSTMKWRI